MVVNKQLFVCHNMYSGHGLRFLKLFIDRYVKFEMKECLRVSKYQVTLHFVKCTTDAFVRK